MTDPCLAMPPASRWRPLPIHPSFPFTPPPHSDLLIAGSLPHCNRLIPHRIGRLNQDGLDHMQSSIDNVMPYEVSKKSLKVLDKKLQMLAEYADFHVNINSVVGGGTKDPEDALTIGKRAVELGFTSTIGIIHDGDGQLKALGEHEREVYL